MTSCQRRDTRQMETALDTLHRKLAQLHQSKGNVSFGRDLAVGLETRRARDKYRWDGLRRWSDPRHPYFVFQYTLDGWGCYATGGAVQRVEPGMAFTAVIPSRHVYYLPRESPQWTFFWIIVRHPYLVSRITQRQRSCGAVMSIPPDSVLMAHAVHLFQGVCESGFRDEFAAEQAMLQFMVEYDRFGHQLVYPQQRRQRLLEETRAFVLSHLRQPITVDQLAQRRDMSRSHFSHHFRAATGLSPARFITETRLQEVTRRLTQTHDTLKAIAADTGFADANHLCKAFRRVYHLTPGAYRRQVR